MSEEDKLDREALVEARDDNEAARLWISGIEVAGSAKSVCAAFTICRRPPFFLRGSGYQEGTLFPWVVSQTSASWMQSSAASSSCPASRRR